MVSTFVTLYVLRTRINVRALTNNSGKDDDGFSAGVAGRNVGPVRVGQESGRETTRKNNDTRRKKNKSSSFIMHAFF